jgi:hypothetical protein
MTGGVTIGYQYLTSGAGSSKFVGNLDVWNCAWQVQRLPLFRTIAMGVQTMSKSYARRTAKNDPKGDRRSRTFYPEAEQFPLTSGTPAGTSPQHLTGEQTIAELLTRGDGWVRCTGSLDLKTVYLKYKYNSGPWRGYYVMAVCTYDQLLWGMQLLVAKTNQVDLGIIKPSKDTPYDWD